jgi:hypothetical protein
VSRSSSAVEFWRYYELLQYAISACCRSIESNLPGNSSDFFPPPPSDLVNRLVIRTSRRVMLSDVLKPGNRLDTIEGTVPWPNGHNSRLYFAYRFRKIQNLWLSRCFHSDGWAAAWIEGLLQVFIPMWDVCPIPPIRLPPESIECTSDMVFLCPSFAIIDFSICQIRPEIY